MGDVNFEDGEERVFVSDGGVSVADGHPGYGGGVHVTDGPGFGGVNVTDGPGFGGVHVTDGPGFGGVHVTDGPGFGDVNVVDGPGFGGGVLVVDHDFGSVNTSDGGVNVVDLAGGHGHPGARSGGADEAAEECEEEEVEDGE